jgi:hypothetical protein
LCGTREFHSFAAHAKLRIMRLLLFTLTLLFIFGSCSKDVRYTNKVNGSWKIDEISGTHTTSSIDGTIYFNNCDIVDEDFRLMREDYSYQLGDSTVIVKHSGAYKFADKGKTLLLRRTIHGEKTVTAYTVKALTKNSLSFSGPENGMMRSYRLSKLK